MTLDVDAIETALTDGEPLISLTERTYIADIQALITAVREERRQRADVEALLQALYQHDADLRAALARHAATDPNADRRAAFADVLNWLD